MEAIHARSILIRRKSLDGWFISRAGMNLYRGCAHDCIYCDGRSERYRVEGDFADDAVYKANAVEILSRELDPRRKRKPFHPGFLFIGGGISDSWQPAEEQLRLTRRVLELFRVFPQPLLLLTKSKLILRDLDLLTALNAECPVIVAVSLSTADDEIASILEPGAALPSERLEVVSRAAEVGLGTGVMLLPVVPLITDTPERLDASYRAAKEAGARFVCCGAMTLKPGRQKDHFLKIAEKSFPDAASAYGTVYGAVPDRWGNPASAYYEYFGPLVHETALRYGLPRRIPAEMFPGNISPAERASVMLEQMDSLMRERGLTSGWGRASRSLANLEGPHEDPAVWKNLRRLGGVGPATERVIREILDTGTSRVYRRILLGGRPSD